MRAAVFLVQNHLDLVERKCAYIVPQERELVRVGLGQQVGPGAEQLSELDEGRAQVLADEAKASRTVMLGDLVSERDSLDRPGDPFEMKRRHDVLIAVPNQGREDLTIPWKVSKMADRLRNHDDPPFDADPSRGFLTPLSLTRYTARRKAAEQLPAVFILQPSDHLVKLSFMLEIEKLGGFGNHTC